MAARGTQAIPIASAARATVDVVTLGRFAISGPGVAPDAGTGRPLALLKVLIALGGQAVSAAQAGDALWPHAEGDAAHRALITNLQRLRRLIGPDAVVLRGGRVTLVPERCRVDALRLPVQLDALDDAADAQSIRRHARAVLELYRGRFLPGDFDPPEIVSTRTRLHARVVQGLAAAGERLVHAGCCAEAIELLREALEIDDRSEALYRPLLRACVQSARWSDGVEVFERCREAMRESYGVGPSPETLQLYRACAERGGAPAVAPAATPKALEEEQRHVSVVLVAKAADARGARRGAERTVAWFGGTLQEAGHDALLAVFGAPTAHEDDAERAVRAACALVREGCAPRAAVASGAAIVRRDGEGGRMGLDGEPVAEAQRLLEVAGPAQVVIGEATRSRVADYFDCETAPEAARGTRAWRVAAATGAETHFAASRQRGLAPFLGRRSELERLRDGLQRARNGEGGLIVVSGEPGIGKSRLLFEFAAGVDSHGATVVEAACGAYGERTPYDPFIRAVRALLALDAAATADEQARGVAERMRRLDPDLPRYASYVQRLLSLPVAGELASGVTLRRLTREAIGALVATASREGALVLLLEDWHWSDEASNEVLRHLQALVPAHRVLLVLTQRGAHPLAGLASSGLEMMRLGPLGEVESLALVRNRLGGANVSERLARLVQQRAGGNPFFIEEICRGLPTETHAGDDGTDPAIPETVQGMIRSRLDDIDRAARETALSAAVIGREFPLRLLLELHDDREGLEDALDRLKAHDLIHQTGVLPEVAYRFKHALTQVVAYDALVPARRRALHGRAGAAIERLHASRLEEHLESLAHHFAAAADVERAVKYLELAGDKAARAHAAAAAAANYRQAIALLDAPAPAPKAMRRRIDLSCKWAEVTHYVSAHETLQVLGRSLALARRLGDGVREARAHYWIGRTHHLFGRPRDALPCFRRALARTRAAPGSGIEPQLHACIGRAAFTRGDLPEAVRELELALDGLEFARDPGELIYSTSFLALSLSQQGAFDRCFAAHEEALRLARAVGDRTREAAALLRLSISRVAMGDWPAAITVARDAIAMAERVENPMITGWALCNEGQSRFMLEGGEAGIALCERGLELLEGSGAHLGFSIYLASLADLYALAGNWDRAEEVAARALALRKGGAHLGLYFAYHALARVAELRAPADLRLARARLAAAHRMAHASGAWPAVAIGRLRKAELEARCGAPDLARAALCEAVKRFESLGMPWWLNRARALEADLGSGAVTGLLPASV